MKKRKANNNAVKHRSDWMKKRVDSKLGKQIYSSHISVVEPVFANIGTNKQLNRFSLRGKTKVQGQILFCVTFVNSLCVGVQVVWEN